MRILFGTILAAAAFVANGGEPVERRCRAIDKEKRCVTMSRLKSVKPEAGRELGRLATRRSEEIDDSGSVWWSVGCECMDRDYADWNAYKELLPMLGVKH